MPTLTMLLMLVALVLIVAEAMGKVPPWPSKILLWLVLALLVWPR